MARRIGRRPQGGFRLRGTRATAQFPTGEIEGWIDDISKTLAQKAAERVVYDLKEIGPYWTGQFEAGWRVKVGDVNIAATEERYSGPVPASPLPRRVTPVTIPKPRGRPGTNTNYTIGNITKHRDIAMDLVPGANGVLRGDRPRATTDKDWYITYVEAGPLRRALIEAGAETARVPAIRGFKGTKAARARIR